MSAEHEKRRRYTWRKPGDTRRFQLDYILVRQRYRNSVRRVGADSDHTLVVMRKVVTFMRHGKRMLKWDLANMEKRAEIRG